MSTRSRPLRGLTLIGHPLLNKDTAFSHDERDRFGRRGWSRWRWSATCRPAVDRAIWIPDYLPLEPG